MLKLNNNMTNMTRILTMTVTKQEL